MGTVEAVFQDCVHMLTALRLWSWTITITAASDKPRSLLLSPIGVNTERKFGLKLVAQWRAL